MTETADTVAGKLLSRWNRLLPNTAEVAEMLLASYAEPARHYHNLGHLRSVLDTVVALADQAADVMLVELAAWFHDAVYDVSRQDNEERSALLAESTLAHAGLTSEQVREVARLVRLTATHAATVDDANGAVLCDADLVILASECDSYAAYVRAVRREFAHVSDDDWRVGRAAVLEELLAMPTLFKASLGRRDWEPRARAALRRELTTLT